MIKESSVASSQLSLAYFRFLLFIFTSFPFLEVVSQINMQFMLMEQNQVQH